MAMNFEPHECIILAQLTKTGSGTNENYIHELFR